MKKSAILIISMLITVSTISAGQAKVLLELRAGPDFTIDDALGFLDLETEKFMEQDLITSLSLGLLMANFLGMSVEGTLRSPQYINNRFTGTGFETGYVNLFLDLFIIRAGLGADLLTITNTDRIVKAFAGIVIKFRKLAFVAQGTRYGMYTYPDAITFSTYDRVGVQAGFTLMFGGKKKVTWDTKKDEEWKTFWQNRFNESSQPVPAEKTPVNRRYY